MAQTVRDFGVKPEAATEEEEMGVAETAVWDQEADSMMRIWMLFTRKATDISARTDTLLVD